MKLELSTQFSCAHFYKNAKFSTEENQANFGKCFHPHGHGHDYQLKVCFRLNSHSSIEDQTQELQKALSELREQLDHKHLNHNIPSFSQNIPTTENVANYCVQFLHKSHLKQKIERLTLFEQANLWVEVIANS